MPDASPKPHAPAACGGTRPRRCDAQLGPRDEHDLLRVVGHVGRHPTFGAPRLPPRRRPSGFSPSETCLHAGFEASLVPCHRLRRLHDRSNGMLHLSILPTHPWLMALRRLHHRLARRAVDRCQGYLEKIQ
jgi:hypothetical protein